RSAVRERLGDDVFDEDGAIVRSRVAAIVFADRDQLAWLEGVLHPRVARDETAWRERLSLGPRPPALPGTDSPRVYEAGRAARLLPDAEKVARADYAYENTGSLEELDRFVARVVEDLSRDC